MTKKQLVVVWVTAILFITILGLETTTVYPLSEVEKLGGPTYGHTALMLYGSMMLTSASAGPLSFLLFLGEYKVMLLIAVLIMGIVSIYSLRNGIR